MKKCSKCEQTKGNDAFYADARRKDGLQVCCKQCCSAMSKASRQKLKAEDKATPTEKSCTDCKTTKPASEFFKNATTSDGLQGVCKQCHGKRSAANPTSEKSRRWYAKNRDHMKAYFKVNRSRYYANNTARRAKRLCATPAWANEISIREVYDFAQEFRNAGFDVHVDHIEPLQGKTVCGLHVEQNLRVCLADVNRSKGNRQLEQFQ
jgi:hypothetical protein